MVGFGKREVNSKYFIFNYSLDGQNNFLFLFYMQQEVGDGVCAGLEDKRPPRLLY
jgi:hypothetical protein